MTARRALPPPAGAGDLGAALRGRYRDEPEPVAPTAQDVAEPRAQEPATPRRSTATRPRARGVVTSRRNRPARPDATADTTVSTTVRFDGDESMANDEMVLRMRREGRLKRLDKSEVIRGLLQLAREDPELRRRVLDLLS
jgi:hypothetical protein